MSALSSRAPARVSVQARPEPILDAALETFTLLGLRRSTMDDIARAAGVGRMTVYRRFARKELLIQAVLGRELERFIGELDDAVGDLTSVEDRIVEGFVFSIEAVRRHPLISRMLETEPEEILPYMTREAAPVLAMARLALAERLWAASADRKLDPSDSEVMAEVIVRLMQSFVLTPDGAVTLDDPPAMRTFARRFLAPIAAA